MNTEKNILIQPPDQIFTPEVKKSIIKVLLAVLVGFGIAALPTPEGLSPEGHKLLGLTATIIILWVSEAIPIGVTALLVGASQILFQIQKPGPAWEPYALPSVMFVLMIVMFGTIMHEVGITKRILPAITRVAKTTNVAKLTLVIAMVSALLATVFHDATVTLIFCYAFLPVFAMMGLPPEKRNDLTKFIMIMIPLSASAGGFGTLLGGGRCPIALEFLAKADPTWYISFAEFALRNFPLVFVTGFISWLVPYMIWRPKMKELPVTLQSEKLPPMTWQEKGVLLSFLVALAAWMFAGTLNIHVSVVAAFVFVVIFGLNMVDFKAVVQKFPWDVWLVFGAGCSLGMALMNTGAGEFIAWKIIPILEGKNMLVTFGGIGVLTSILTSFMNNTAAVALMAPISLPMAEGMNLPLAPVALWLPIQASFIWLVIGCPPTLIAYATGYFSQVDFTKTALCWAMVCVIMTTLVGVGMYWPLSGFGDLPFMGILR